VHRLRTPGRPRLWFEIVLIAVSYWTYSLVRNAVPEQKADALRNADWIWQVEETLGTGWEKTVNHAVNSVQWLIVGMNYYYATLHFIVTIGVLVWLYRRHPGRYAPARLALFATTGVALLGYYLYPLAPPRLMSGKGFVDTVLVHETWGSMASGDLADVSNQYAAMPSMHIGWAVWCGIALVTLARAAWVRALGLLYPGLTFIVIVATANHFWLDAVGGMLCLAFGLSLSFAWYGRLPHRLPRAPVEPCEPGAASAGGHAGDLGTGVAQPTGPTASAAADRPGDAAAGKEPRAGAAGGNEAPGRPDDARSPRPRLTPAPCVEASGDRPEHTVGS
jgi:hypothetical protein